jgi:hypothetical protein
MSPDDPRLVRRRRRCRFCRARPFAIYDLRGPTVPAPEPPGALQPVALAPLCWDHHAEIAAAEDGWPDPITGTRWRLYKRIEVRYR